MYISPAAVGLEVFEDVGGGRASRHFGGLSTGLALDPREDGRDGVDAVPGGVEAGHGFAFRGLRTA